jgi:hypothetical protein
MSEPILDLTDESPQEAIGLAMGAVSVCWETPDGAGVFDSTRARRICDELTSHLGLDPHDHDGEADDEYGAVIDPHREFLEQRGPSDPTSFLDELRALINRHSVENRSSTPDFILAVFLNDVLDDWAQAVRARDTWYGEGHD